MTCSDADPNVLDWILGIFILVAIYAATIDQPIQFLLRRDHEGCSFLTMGLNVAANGFQTAVSLGVQFPILVCMAQHRESVFPGIGLLLPSIQVISNLACAWVIYAMGLAVFRTRDLPENVRLRSIVWVSFLLLNGVVLFVPLTTVVGLSLAAHFVAAHSSLLLHIAEYCMFACTVAGAIVSLVIWLPQLRATYILKSRGSLSFFMVGISCPGNYIIGFYQLFYDSVFLAIPTLIVALEMTALLYLMFYYSIRACLKSRSNSSPPLNDPSLHPALLDSNDISSIPASNSITDPISNPTSIQVSI